MRQIDNERGREGRRETERAREGERQREKEKAETERKKRTVGVTRYFIKQPLALELPQLT